MKLKTLFTAVNLLALAALPLGAAELTKLSSTPGANKIRIEGTSTIHDWQVESSVIGGYAEVGPEFPLKPGAEVKPGKVDAKVSVFIPVQQLKSLEKDGKPYSDKMDKRMYEAVNEPANKKITYNLTSLTLKEAPKAAGAPYQFESTGELCVAGVTNKIAMPVMVTVLEENKVKFAGTVTVKMTDFKIEPINISILGIGLIKTGDEVKLFFEWVATKKSLPAAK
jgi:hypothetical protein